MRFAISVLVLIGAVSGCYHLYSPECGKNGRTYVNDCFRSSDKVELAFKGKCIDGCSLPKESGICMAYFPRFAFNNNTNTCEAFIYGGCAGNVNNFETEAECLGTCLPEAKPIDQCICLQVWNPVCGTDGKTYSNNCFAECAKVDIASAGECPAQTEPTECTCIEVYEPVCGADGVTYSNKCFAACSGQTQVTEGGCAEETSAASECFCMDLWEPMCGADGKTYSNACFAACAKVNVTAAGECPAADCVCLQVYEPVCGADGKTYSNACTAACAGITVAATGECAADKPNPNDDCFCPSRYEPVCGFDGRTYKNKCRAECELAVIDHEGPCDFN